MAAWPYNTAAWQRLREAHLSLSPMCIGCEAMGVLTMANTVDHVVPISEGGHAFPGHDGLASYCPACHGAKTARGAEAGAARSTRSRKGCDADGNPLDPSHPWNGGNGYLTADAIERRMPSDLAPSHIPLTIVTGPSGAGKSTYVRERAGDRDRIICLDTIMSKITGHPEHHAPAWALRKALETRNAMLRKLANDTKHDMAWFIVSAPRPDERRAWSSRLGGTLVVLDTQLPECVRRIRSDQRKTNNAVDVPVVPLLRDAIDAGPLGQVLLLEAKGGESFTPKGFYGMMKRACHKAGIGHCSPHGLRKSAARRCREAGCSDEEGMAITGHKTVKEYRRYAGDSGHGERADAAMAKVMANHAKKLAADTLQATGKVQ